MQASAEQQFKGARSSDETIARAYEFADLSSYSLGQRFMIRAADLVFFVLIKLIGRTMRWQVKGWENWEAATQQRANSDLLFLAQSNFPWHLLFQESRHRRHDFAEFRRRIHRAGLFNGSATAPCAAPARAAPSER